MNAYRYSEWDGTQTVDPFTAKELMDHLSDQMLDGRDLFSAMRDMMQRGARLPNGRQMPGLRDLLDRLKNQRQEQLHRYNMDSVMDDIKEKLEDVVKTEREGIQRRLDQTGGQQSPDREGGNDPSSSQQGQPRGEQSPDRKGGNDPSSSQQEPPDDQLRKMLEGMAQKHLDQLEKLPPTTGGKLQELREYDFMDLEARQKFEDLLETLKKQVMEQYFQGLKDSLGAMTPEMMQQARDMVRDLNQLLREHQEGNDSGFEDFMDKWGQFFPDGIDSVEQLARHMQQQMQAMQSLMDSMSPEMRQELSDMMGALMNDPDLQDELSDLIFNLDQVFPTERRGKQPFSGDEPITLQEALRRMNDMNGLDELEKELMEAIRNNDSGLLDNDKVEHLLGEEARKIAEELQEFAKLLEQAGLIRRKGNQWELTPRAMKKVAERALQEIFGHVDKGLTGDHTKDRFGWGVDRLDETKTYEFGDMFSVDLQGTLKNALVREGPGVPVHLTVDDFEVFKTASINQCSTVILLDMSYSMFRNGRFLAGRRVAMALDSLIRSKFPRDVLHIAAFSYFVLPLKHQQLLETHWIDPGGTDIPEAIRMGREMLKDVKDGTKQIILITDGMPHANAYGYDYGRYEHGWSMREAMEETLREVSKCTRRGIRVNTFMLDTDPVINTFIKSYTKVNKGRIFFADPHQLGEYLIVDYMKNRRVRA